MKRRNLTNRIMQQGGLMIEALAMLGLIAVVTPTMYKKSAERTMEVEDINTATTVRTIMGAAESYVAANYATITSDMIKNNQQVREIPMPNLDNYLPYKFDTDKALYNYNKPKVALVRQDNNLTVFVLFPAKNDADSGIGQERTARIAALVGSNGGYVNANKSARGVGGIWSLNTADFSNTFKDQNPNIYSLVTASADTISASAGNEIDNDKYLQRGKDDNDGDENLWKNTMRTDLYMGREYSDDDEADMYKNAAGPFSIRNINSLIVGSERAALGAADADGNQAETGNYGLYISPAATNRNAFIAENLEAAASNFRVSQDFLGFGPTVPGSNDIGSYSFSVERNGNTLTYGNLTVDKDVYLANAAGLWDDVKIGSIDIHPGNPDADDYAIKIKRSIENNAPFGRVTILDDKIMQVNNFGTNDVSAPTEDRIVLMDDGLKKVSGDEDGGGEDVPTISYNNAAAPVFPVRIGSNTKVEGLLTAAQFDTQKLRAATLSVGSEHIDDANKWLNADKDGVTIKDPAYPVDEEAKDAGLSGTRLRIANDIIAMHVGAATNLDEPYGLNISSNSEQVVLRKGVRTSVYGTELDLRGEKGATMTGRRVLLQALSEKNGDGYKDLDDINDTYSTVKENTVMLRNNNMQMRMNDNELRISGRTSATDGDEVLSTNKKYRTVFSGGNLDLDNTNFNVQALRPTDENGAKTDTKVKQSILSIYGNDDYEKQGEYKDASGANKNIFYDRNTNTKGKYDLAMHGDILITDGLGGQNATKGSLGGTTYVSASSTGFNSDAGINIVTKNVKNSQSGMEYYKYKKRNIILIDQGAVKTVQDNTSNSNSGSAQSVPNYHDKATNGTIYIRKGYLEVTPNIVNMKEKDPLNGNGVIVASRLVANNSPLTSTPGYKVPQLINSDALATYNNVNSSDNLHRYDRYMVNPAYTSVMHDIKLVTRGGARLSDILPDFITKGIYVVTNSCGEASIPFPPTSKEQIDGCTNLGKDESYSLGSENAWGSPVLGFVPAPQCPPGYGRVITLTPASFQMAQGGTLGMSNGARGQYYVVPAGLYASADNYLNKDSNGNITETRFKKASVDKNNSKEAAYISIPPSTVRPPITATSGKLTVNGMSNIATKDYVLTSNNADAKGPMYIQQSTWLKSYALKMVNSNNYVQGWAAIMGFVYPESMYSGFATAVGSNPLKLSKDKGSAYWNLFPVLRSSMEGYATVYCYFDRTNLMANDFVDGASKYINTNVNYSSPADGYGKTGSNLNRLNDPTLQYNEVW